MFPNIKTSYCTDVFSPNIYFLELVSDRPYVMLTIRLKCFELNLSKSE